MATSRTDKKIEKKRKKLRSQADAKAEVKAEAVLASAETQSGRRESTAGSGKQGKKNARKSGKSSSAGKGSGNKSGRSGARKSDKSASQHKANSKNARKSGKSKAGTAGKAAPASNEGSARSRKSNNSKSRKLESNSVRPAGDDMYAYGSFGFEEYDENAFREDGYEYKEPDRVLTKAEIRNEARIAKKRLNANTSRITPDNRVRLLIGFAFILLLMIALIFRMGYWQIVRADELRIMAAQMQKVDTEIEPVRGTIYDSKMNVLAEAVTEYELYGYTQYLYKDMELKQTEKDDTVRKLAKLTGEDETTVKERLNGSENLVLLAEGLTREQVEEAEENWGSKVMVKTKASRYYPNEAFAAQILGGVNSDNVGRSGLEYEYNSVLAGIKGRTVRTTDRDGNTLSGSKTKYYEPQDGSSIVTTIDSVIQTFVEAALETGMKKTGASEITCIVMNPKTGDILAMATTPEFDPNNASEPYSKSEKKRFKKMSPEQKTDYLSRMWTIDGVSSIYEPGSTFKLITAASALESAKANSKSRYTCNGYIHVANYNLRCLGYHGKQSLKEAVGNSCNPALAQVALDMGAEIFYNYIDLFGFNDKTGIDLPGETNAMVKSTEGMGDVDLATTGYGQGIAVTPLQLLCAVSSFGNGGVIMKPKLVKEILDPEGNVTKTIEDTEVRQVVSENTADKMCDIMEYYVEEAGGDQAYVPGYRVGGKTGTANLVEGSKYASNATNTSFVAMAPMDDPQIAMICIVYRPTRIFYGNYTAGPIVKEIMEKTLQYLGVERQYSKEEAKEIKKNKVKVPHVTEINSSDAIASLKQNELNYKIVPEDGVTENFVVVDQFPKAGRKVEKGSVVYLYSE